MTSRAGATPGARRPDHGAHPAAEDGAADLERLRRRLYRPGADAEDVRRYRAVIAAAAPPAPAPPPAAATRRARSPLRVALAGTAIVLALGAAAVVVRAQAPEETARTALPVTAPARPVVEADDPPVTATRIPPVTAEFRGRGAGTAWLDSAALPARSGRVDLVLTVAETARIRWWVTRVGVGRDGDSMVRIVAEQTWTQTGGVAVPVAFPYRGAPPTAVRMDLPDDVAWSLLVAAAD